MIQKIAWDCSKQNKIAKPIMIIAIQRLKMCCPRKTNGAPETSSCSLANATTDPVNVRAPIMTPTLISILLISRMFPGSPI